LAAPRTPRPRLQFLVSLIDVVARERHIHKRPDPLLIPFRREQHHPHLRLRHAPFDPALFLIERLIIDDGESEFLGIKIQRAILIGDGNANELEG